MKIEEIEVSNFKCFKHLKLKLDDFNTIIGKNASGKSNIINIIKFIKDMLDYGIDSAIDLQGGINYLYNSKIKSIEPIKIRFIINTFDDNTFDLMKILFEDGDIITTLEKYEINVTIKPKKRNDLYSIIENRIKLYYSKLEPIKKEKKKKAFYLKMLNSYKKTMTFVQECYEQNGEIIEEFSSQVPEKLKNRLEIKREFYIARSFGESKDNYLLIWYIPFMNYLSMRSGEKIRFYDFSPKNLKSPSIINKKNTLEEDGSNLPNVLEKILKNDEKKRMLLLILKELMPFVVDISTEKSINKSMYFKVKENNNNDLPSSLLSDGTVNIIAIIVALIFEEDNDIIIIEEPEKNIHPRLANQLVELMQEVSNKKQIIITTHNTYMLKAIDLSNIIYVYRNKEMYSEVERPIDNKKINEFIKNELDIGDLFYEGLISDKEN